jgi:ABC-type transport system involved in multi-copper enzyme maturation permease subunit
MTSGAGAPRVPPPSPPPPWVGAFVIARATRIEAARQPVHIIVVAATLFAFALSPALAMFSLSDDLSLLKDFGVSTALLSSLLLAAFGTASAVSREVELGTAQTLLSKPVHPWTFLAGKLLGVLWAVAAAGVICGVGLVLAVRVGPPAHAHEAVDWPAIAAAGSAVLVSVAWGVGRSLARAATFPLAALRAAVFTFPAAVLLVSIVDRSGSLRPSLDWLDPSVVKALCLNLLASALFGAVTALLSVAMPRGALPATLVLVVVGLSLGTDLSLLGLLPDLQIFWVGEVFYRPDSRIPWAYLVACAAYSAAYGSAALAAAAWLLGRKES